MYNAVEYKLYVLDTRFRYIFTITNTILKLSFLNNVIGTYVGVSW